MENTYRTMPKHSNRRLEGLGAQLGRMAWIERALNKEVTAFDLYPYSSHVYASLIHEYRELMAFVVMHPNSRMKVAGHLSHIDWLEGVLTTGERRRSG